MYIACTKKIKSNILFHEINIHIKMKFHHVNKPIPKSPTGLINTDINNLISWFSRCMMFTVYH